MATAIGTGPGSLLRAISSPLKGWRKQDVSQNDNRGDDLGSVIEGNFLPRLMMQYAKGSVRTTPDPASSIDKEEAENFAALALHLEAAELLARTETILRRGVSVESIFLDLLAPSARELGRLWEDDACDFVDVTMGLWRLQEVMREIAGRSPPMVRSLATTRTALFSPMPGDQHSFGTLIIEEIFARAGWQSEALIDPERRELLRLVADKPFDLIGLTVTNDCPSGPLASLISAIRTVSANPRTAIIIGGKAINENPGLVSEVGADGTAIDAEAALILADTLVEVATLTA